MHYLVLTTATAIDHKRYLQRFAHVFTFTVSHNHKKYLFGRIALKKGVHEMTKLFIDMMENIDSFATISTVPLHHAAEAVQMQHKYQLLILVCVLHAATR
jgi:hypothetical protein